MDHKNILQKLAKLSGYLYYIAIYDGEAKVVNHKQYANFIRIYKNKQKLYIHVFKPKQDRITDNAHEDSYTIPIMFDKITANDITRLCCIFTTSIFIFSGVVSQFVNQFVLRYYLGNHLTQEHKAVKWPSGAVVTPIQYEYFYTSGRTSLKGILGVHDTDCGWSNYKFTALVHFI